MQRLLQASLACHAMQRGTKHTHPTPGSHSSYLPSQLTAWLSSPVPCLLTSPQHIYFCYSALRDSMLFMHSELGREKQ